MSLETRKRFTKQADFDALAQNVQSITTAVNLLVTRLGGTNYGESPSPSPPRKQTRIGDPIQVTPYTPSLTTRQRDAEMGEAGEGS